MKTDIEIAQAASMLPIHEIADRLGILPEELEPYGRYKAKLSESCLLYTSPSPRDRG